MVDQIVKGEEVTVNDTETYENGMMVVPTYLLEPVVINAENAREKLVDSGYYSAIEIGLE